ncbi:MAG: class II aldolase/adducin family protein [Alphaproteobacteria bacterium]|nr:class II aldolase/adducin family protein [Alphaproteobacteria bacterium]
MSTVTAFRPPASPQELSENEVRVQLAACYRLGAHFGMDDLVFTHISARVPGTHEHFFINPYGLHFSEITASSLVKIDLDGKIVEDNGHPVNEAGFVIHSAVHAARPDVACVLHTHTRSGIAVSCLEEGLLPLNQFSLQFYNRIAYHDYEGVALDLDERQRLVADLGDKRVMILRNHGLLTAGRTIPEAFSLMYYLDQSCRIQIEVMSSGGKMLIVPGQTGEKTARVFERHDMPGGQREWPALLRLLDKLDPGYRN